MDENKKRIVLQARRSVDEKMYNYTTGEHEYFGFIGLFWYIDDKNVIEYVSFDLAKEMEKSVNANSAFITPPISHPMLWASKSKAKLASDKGYDYYPRGRVNYNVGKDIFELDMDGCIHKMPTVINELYKIFLLDKRKTIVIPAPQTNKNSPNYRKEGHYTCHICRGD